MKVLLVSLVIKDSKVWRKLNCGRNFVNCWRPAIFVHCDMISN